MMSDMEATSGVSLAGHTDQLDKENQPMEDSSQQRQQQQQQHQRRANSQLAKQRPTSCTSVLSNASGGLINGMGPSGDNRKQHRLKSRFTVIRKLGKGTYGKVQLAINKETGQEVAIKTIKKTKIENEQDLQRVRREIQIMSSIEHPHIIHIYEVFENKDKIVLIMQYAPGGELYEYVSQSKVLDDGEARRLFRQIATAIYYCHQNKICHRDLKLENILLDEKNNAKIADFGLSNVFDKRRQLRTFCGSPLYASPEIVQGSPYEGPEVDCWSLGVLLYTLVYGAMPFDGSNFKRLVKQISEASYYEPKQRSQASPLINRLLCADPAHRATILDICSDPWVNSSPAQASSQPASPKLSPTGHHPSLLKVAQDMANLTPVRVDILLALTPAPPAQPTQAPTHHNNNNNNNSDTEPASNKTNRPNRHNPTIALDASLMEVDENRSTSPVANYIVRNLDGMAGDKAPKADGIPAQSPSEQQTTTNEQAQQEARADEASGLVLEVTSREIPDSQREATMEATGEPTTGARDESRPEGVRAQLENEKMEMEAPEEWVAPTSEPADGEKGERSQEQTTLKDQEEATRMLVEEEEEQKRPDEASMEAAEEEPAKEEEPPRQVDSDTQVAAQVGPVELEQKRAEEEEEKPKKKKKIVIVKKKRKVVKRDTEPGLTAATENENTQPTGEQDKSSEMSTRTQDDQQQQTTKPTPAPTAKVAPVGRVRIPETFKPTPDDEGAEQPLRGASMTSRRQSALIAGVSQKLIQQQQQHLEGAASSGAAIDADQPQLSGVRVSDKKSEFERRASEVAAMELARGSTPSAASAAKETPVEESSAAKETSKPMREPVRVSASREALRLLDRVEQTIVEPIAVRRALEAQPPVALRPPEVPSEPLTPTEASLASPDVARRLSECADRLRSGDRSPSSLEATRDDRSDSVDTIRAELMSLDSPDQPNAPNQANIRSSLQINLAAAQQQQQQAQTTQIGGPARQTSGTPASLLVGPAPITRSYKKVTFTKDGTCITETGRIYSTQADDGTVRRVQRKSKVTHYPGEPSSSWSDARASDEVHEEREEVVIGGDNNRAWQESQMGSSSSSSLLSNKRQLPFERLIMPSADLFATDDYDDQFTGRRPNVIEGGARGSRRQSATSGYQRGRADSASSCSSGSTDVFDDTFDTWTGAISMFNQNRRISNLHSSLISRAFGEGSPLPFGDSILGSRRRGAGSHHQGRPQSGPFGGSSTGSAFAGRCESVEPDGQRSHRHREARRRNGSERGPRDGYESDAATFDDKRPASSMGSARGRAFGSSNLFPRYAAADSSNDPDSNGDPFELFVHKQSDLFGDSLFEELQMEHERLKQRLSQRHKQLWRGSSPSLHDDNRHQQHKRQQQGPPLHQSSSGNQANTRQSVPLTAAPTRREPANSEHLPPRQSAGSAARRSSSRTSLITSQLANVQIGGAGGSSSSVDGRARRHHQVASFIELKRTPSNSQQQQQQPRREPGSTGLAPEVALESAASTSNNSHWTGERPTPEGSLIMSSAGNSRQPSLAHELQQSGSPDSRIHSWLQQSAGNLSISSGSKSSASDTIPSSGASRSDHQSLFMVPIQHQQADSLASMNSGGPGAANVRLPPPAPSRSPNRAQQVQQQRSQHYTSSTVRSCSRQSMEGGEQGQLVETRQAEQVASSKRGQLLSHTSSATKVSREVFNFAGRKSSLLAQHNHQDARQAWPEPLQHKNHGDEEEEEAGPFDSFCWRPGGPSTAPTSGRNSDGLHWAQESSSELVSSSSRLLATTGGLSDELDADSLSGSGADLDARSSSSLLDQLRSRGYRSMINQRLQPAMISETTAATTSSSVHSEQQLSSRVVSSTSVSTGTSRSYVTTSTTMTVSGSAAAAAAAAAAPSKSPPTDAGRPLDDELEALLSLPIKQLQLATDRDMNNNDDNFDALHKLVADDDDNDNDDGDKPAESKPHEPLECTQRVAANQWEPTNGIGHEPQAADCNGSSPGNATGASCRGEPEGQQEDMDEDEDVREAKANIKEYLDRVRETEKFLKSMQEEEETMERQRQELFVFNQLMLSRKLNGIRGASLSLKQQQQQVEPASSSATGALDNWPTEPGRRAPRSAPIWAELGSAGAAGNSSNGFIPHSSTSTAFSCFSSDLYRPVVGASHTTTDPSTQDPYLEPVQPVCLNGGGPLSTSSYQGRRSPGAAWRRSKSQLGDQFSNYIGGHLASVSGSNYVPRTTTTNRRPLSATISTETNPYFPSSRHRRSVSQMRTPTSGASSLTIGQARHRQTSPVMSEYRSAFAAPSSGHGSPARRAASPQANRLPNRSDDEEDDHDDDQMASYRAHSYVPKVVPGGGPRGRDFGRRYSSSSSARHLFASSPASRLDSLSPPAVNNKLPVRTVAKPYNERRTSLQLLSTSPTSTSQRPSREVHLDRKAPIRRRSATDSGQPVEVATENSRLSELEQRIQANKRRREELLSGKAAGASEEATNLPVARKETLQNDDDDEDDEDDGFERPPRPAASVSSMRDSSPAGRHDEMSPASNRSARPATRPRSSRLESMEARIKRRSYCVRMASPERPARRSLAVRPQTSDDHLQ